ncbi:MAG: serine/threonine-protein kinase [Thermoanaerobaculia bacterium]
MSPPAWERVKEELAALLELPVTLRGEVLTRLRAEDPELAAEVDSLLDGAGEVTSFLETPAPHRIRPTRGEGHDETGAAPPTRIGPWRIVGEIGRGGMGTVYLGERDDGAFSQSVAIKLVRPELASEQLRRRFLAERRILASLDHPNIARLLDGGATNEGVPFLVLEFVSGEPIDLYCEARRLPLEERLRLMAAVCGAVHHAHRNLVLHRDIKTANILVTADGVPKLLDFGIAKLLSSETEGEELTSFGGARLLTPEWASPEQLRGELLTTASDVYSLGVLLFVLLTGARPHSADSASTEALAAAIDASPPPRLEGAAAGIEERRLQGDLAWITQRALAPEPSRRYATAAGLAIDLESFLAGSPVEAHPPDLRYRLGKFLRRHRAAAAALTVAIGCLVAATAVSVRQAAIANRERELAERRFGDVRRLANVVLFEVQDSLSDVPGALAARQLLVENALRYLDDLAREAGDEPALLRELASAYERVGELQGTPNWSSAGKSGDALASFERALALRERLAGSAVSGAVLAQEQVKLADTQLKVGDVLATRGETKAALDHHRIAGRIYEGIAAGKPRETNADLDRQLAVVEVALGDDSWELGDRAGAMEHFRKALAYASAARTLEPQENVPLRQCGVIEQRLGDGEVAAKNWGAALAHYRASLAIDEELSRRAPESAETLRDLGVDYARMGVIARAGGELETALETFRRGSALREHLLAGAPGDVRAIADAAESQFQEAQVLAALGRARESVAPAAKAIRRWRDLVNTDPDNVRWLDALAQALSEQARWDAAAGARSEAEARIREAIALRRTIASGHPDYDRNAPLLSDLQRMLDRVRAGDALPALDPELGISP